MTAVKVGGRATAVEGDHYGDGGITIMDVGND